MLSIGFSLFYSLDFVWIESHKRPPRHFASFFLCLVWALLYITPYHSILYILGGYSLAVSLLLVIGIVNDIVSYVYLLKITYTYFIWV